MERVQTRNRLQEMVHELLTSKQHPESKVSVDTLKTIIKSALGNRYSDRQLNYALETLGVPKKGVISIAEFCAQLATPTTHAVTKLKEQDLGSWLTIDEWRQVLERLGMKLTVGQTERLVNLTKKQTMDDIVRERLALEKIGISLSTQDLRKIITDAQKVAVSVSDSSSDDSSDYETEEEVTVYE